MLLAGTSLTSTRSKPLRCSNPSMGHTRISTFPLLIAFHSELTRRRGDSSIAFRSGLWMPTINHNELPSRYSLEPMQVPNSTFEKPLFERKLQELHLMGDFTGRSSWLADAFTDEELRSSISRAPIGSGAGARNDQ